MSTQLKNLLAFNLIPGASVVLTHELNNGAIPVEPDVIWIPSADLAVTLVTDTTFTLTNQGGTDLVGSVLVEAWHTIERAFGDAAVIDLTPKPYIFVGSEVSGSTPQPAFQDPPIVVTIYARLAGSDVVGTGTLANPYRTFQRAIRDVPSFIPPGVRYIVDCTGIGLEVLPDDFALPSWKSTAVYSGYDFGSPYFYLTPAVRLQAEPQLAAAIPPADAVIAAGAIVPDPDNDIATLTVGAPVASWAADALAGFYLVDPSSSFNKGVIIASTATTITFTDTLDAPFFTFPLQIVEPSAILEGQASAAAFANGAIASSHQDSLSWGGFEIRPSNPFVGPGLITMGGVQGFELCNLDQVVVRQQSFSEIIACNLDTPTLESTLFVFACRITNAVGTWCASDGGILFFLAGTVLDGCDPLAPSNAFVLMFNGLIVNAVTHGVSQVGGTWAVFDTKIDNFAGNGYMCQAGMATLFHLTGVGAVGSNVGIRALDGCQIQSDFDAAAGPTTIAGATDDQEVGDLGPAAYPAAPASIYDITAVGAGGATGTGARLFAL